MVWPRGVAGLGLALALLAGATGAARAQAQPTAAEEKPEPTPYDRGRISLGFAAGSQSGIDPNERHFFLGGGVGYYVLPGLQLGVQGIKLFGATPSIAMLSPNIRYVFVQVPGSIKPFVGAFHMHWFIGDAFDDVDTAGARSGVVIARGSLVIALGLAYERVVSECTGDCAEVYPEIGFGISL
jgi:hypothetical protein